MTNTTNTGPKRKSKERELMAERILLFTVNGTDYHCTLKPIDQTDAWIADAEELLRLEKQAVAFQGAGDIEEMLKVRKQWRDTLADLVLGYADFSQEERGKIIAQGLTSKQLIDAYYMIEETVDPFVMNVKAKEQKTMETLDRMVQMVNSEHFAKMLSGTPKPSG